MHGAAELLQRLPKQLHYSATEGTIISRVIGDICMNHSAKGERIISYLDAHSVGELAKQF
jgi:hypothetical protein